MRASLAPFFLLLASALPSCGGADVVLYCAADREHAEPMLRDFERESGLAVKAVFDIEAAKTVGLVNTLIEERSRPRADVFWNNEIVHTLRLKAEGLLAPYDSPSAADVPVAFRDPEKYWTGFAARARVLIVNAEKVPEEDRPKSVFDLAEPKWKGRVGFPRPLSGTALTHFAVLFEVLGEEKARKFADDLIRNEVNLPSGNAPCARLVADGVLDFGCVDTDDAESMRIDGKPVVALFPDQEGLGTLLIPNSIALVRGGPHPEEGKRLIDWLLRPQTEARLAASPSANIPVRDFVPTPASVRRMGTFRAMDVDFAAVARDLEARVESLRALFLR